MDGRVPAGEGAKQRVIYVEVLQPSKKSERSNVYDRINGFLDSKFGTAVLTFLLTAVLGGLISSAISSYQSAQAAKIAEAREASARRAEFRNQMASQLVSRSTAAILVGSSLANRMPAADVERRWQEYEKSYIKYNEMTFLFRASADGLKPRRFFGPNHLLVARDRYITPSFTRMDRCITRAYVDAAKSRPQLTVGDSLICGQRSDDTVWDMKAENAGLRACMQTYQKQVEDLIWLQDRFALQSLGRDEVEAFRQEKSCRKGEYACNYVKAWDDLERVLKTGCGQLDALRYRTEAALVTTV